MNFGTLKTRLLAQIGRAPSDLCYELATAEINQKLRVREMLSTADLVESTSISLPSDFRQARNVYLNTDPKRILNPTTSVGVIERANGGLASEYAINGSTMTLDSDSGGSEVVKLEYYAELPELAADTDTNVVLTTYPSVYIYGVLAHHAALTQNTEALAIHFPAFERAMMKAMQDDNRSRSSGASTMVRVGSAP